MDQSNLVSACRTLPYEKITKSRVKKIETSKALTDGPNQSRLRLSHPEKGEEDEASQDHKITRPGFERLSQADGPKQSRLHLPNTEEE